MLLLWGLAEVPGGSCEIVNTHKKRKEKGMHQPTEGMSLTVSTLTLLKEEPMIKV